MLDAFIVDIALMVYSEKQFARRESSDVDTRLAALLSHRAVTRTHGVAMLMTEDLVAELLTTFPWNATDDRALRDLRTFALQDLNRALMVRPIGDGRVSIDPDGVLALRVNRQSTVKAWHDLLAGALIGEA